MKVLISLKDRLRERRKETDRSKDEVEREKDNRDREKERQN